MRKWLILILCVMLAAGFFVLIHAPSEGTRRFGRNFNSERKARGIPGIPENWEVESDYDNVSRWYDPRAKREDHPIAPYHRSKQVVWSRSCTRPTREIDEYVNTTTYTDTDGVFNEELYILYDYAKESNGLDPWDCDLFMDRSKCLPWGATRGRVSLAEANDILKDWGILRVGKGE